VEAKIIKYHITDEQDSDIEMDVFEEHLSRLFPNCTNKPKAIGVVPRKFKYIEYAINENNVIGRIDVAYRSILTSVEVSGDDAEGIVKILMQDKDILWKRL